MRKKRVHEYKENADKFQKIGTSGIVSLVYVGKEEINKST